MRRLTLLVIIFRIFACSAQDKHPDVLPSVSQVQWADAEIGAIFHFDVPTFVPGYNWHSYGTHPPASVFNPGKLNTDQWIAAAKAAGAKYAVLVAKHCSGFSLWPTEAHEYSVKNCPWKNGKGDLVSDFIASCKKYGIRPGIYASAAANGFLHVADPGKVDSAGPVTQQEYNAIVKKQLTELWSNYGKLFEIWFDGGLLPEKDGGLNLAPLLKQLQPNAIVFQGPADAKNLIRWIGNEDGLAPYPNWSTLNIFVKSNGSIKAEDIGGNPGGNVWCPGETDFPLRTGWQGGWFWKADEQTLMPLDKLKENYFTSVGRNSNMLIGIAIDTSGLVPDEDVKLLHDFGSEIKRAFSKPIASMEGSGTLLELNIANTPRTINTVIISEDIIKGEKIRKYLVEAWLQNRWQTIAEGISVGHKRIQRFDPVTTRKIRLKIIVSSGVPRVREFSAFNYSE